MPDRNSSICRFLMLSALLVNSLLSTLTAQKASPAAPRPNVILILTDDQGYGDLGFNGNPDVSTPVIDRFAAGSIRFNNFYVCPVCSPSRASILTGRYNIRTGVYDTYSGGAIMASGETTMAEIFRGAGYTTAQFGKWHLGDSYPSRPQDQGFDSSVWNMGGGIGSEGDVLNYDKGDSAYFNPVLWKNGRKFQSTGYCSDVFTNEAIRYLEQPKKQPFFMYLAFNAPHKPLQLPQNYYDKYRDKPINPEYFRAKGLYAPGMTEKDREDARKVYGMVTNIDDNLGRLFDLLKQKGLYDNTIVIFMTDNGPAQNRFTGGFRGKKSLVREGGIHVPFYLKLPKDMPHAAGHIDEACAHIDILPTLAELCKIKLPAQLKTDGQSMVPLLKKTPGFDPHRALFFEWQRGFPEKYRNMAVIKNGYKLLANAPEAAGISDFELYDLKSDPYEANNLIAAKTAVAQGLKGEMDVWFDDIMKSPNINRLPRINIGNAKQNPVLLNRNEARGIQEIRDQENIHVSWDVKIEQTGAYRVTCVFLNEITLPGTLYFRIGNRNVTILNEKKGIKKLVFDSVNLKQGDFTIDSWYTFNNTFFVTPFYIEVEKIQDVSIQFQPIVSKNPGY